MLTNDRIELPEYDVDHFALYVSIDRLLKTNIHEMLNEKIQIFPNPIIDQINFKIDTEIYSYKIFDFKGNIILNEKYYVNNNPKTINVDFLKPGIYYINIKTNKSQFHEKFIKVD